MAQEAFVVPLTILAALERGVLRYAARTELCIHVVGASYRETTGNGDLEELLHHLPRLHKLIICFVGPEIFNNSGEGIRSVTYVAGEATGGHTFTSSDPIRTSRALMWDSRTIPISSSGSTLE
ncbi:hypothetical protein FISHEDRAFT_69902 [Fistulina hepatica ATCC 64428]|uniref:Mitochondrial splicing suppressor 51-like C-terminal domain-containing protein n=1 Tax=Fistulina hepatica ATCC 64428 TaxID=1128425 RepID=A0A0D7ANY3_9AGAR|nr:hypothetical protein FISHEDRAFT_69902 [Fistulina hepatica ATCC 64428]